MCWDGDEVTLAGVALQREQEVHCGSEPNQHPGTAEQFAEHVII